MKNLNKFLYKYRYWIVLVLALISRFAFTSGYKDFFDSMQYVWRTDSGTLLDALSTGHAPFHPGYIFFTYCSNGLLHLFSIHNTELAASLPSLFFGSLTLLIFFAFTEKLFDTKTAVLASIFAAFVPYFWISNMSIIVDPTMIFFYLLSMYLYLIWLDKKGGKWYWLILSGFSFGWAMWAHTQIAFWALGFVGLLIYKIQPKEWIRYVLKSIPWIIGPIFFICIYLFLLVHSGYTATYAEAAHYLFLGNAGDRMSPSLMPGFRNYILVMSLFLAILSAIGMIKLFIKNSKMAIFLTLWLVPGLFLGALYLYANLYGRASIIAMFPGIMAAAYLLTSWQPKQKFILAMKYLLIFLAIFQLLYISFPIVNSYARERSAYDEMDKLRKTLKPDGGLIILSNLEKTLVGYEGDNAVVWEMPKDEINSKIEKAQKAGKPIFVDMDAMRFPYYQYDGHNWEIKSTNFDFDAKDKSFVSYLYSIYNFDLALTSSLGNKVGTYLAYKDNLSTSERLKNNISVLESTQSLIFGRLYDDDSSSPASQISVDIYSSNEVVSRQKINYHDWLYYMLNSWQKNNGYEPNDPLNWAYTDKSGFFITAIPENETENTYLKATTYNLPLKDVVSKINDESTFNFVNLTQSNIKQQLVSEGEISIDNIDSLVNAFPSETGYYVVLNKSDDNNINYKIYKLNYSLDIGNTLNAELLPHEIGELTSEGIFTEKSGKGYLTYGPWIQLDTGNYDISFRLKTSKNTDDDIIGKLEVTTKNVDTPLASRDLKYEDFPEANKFYDIALSFDTDKPLDEIEFKTIANGVVDLTIEGISINKK